MKRRFQRIRARVLTFTRGNIDDALLLAGIACIAVAASFIAPGGPWLIAGLYLLRSGWNLSRARRQ